MGLAIGVLKSLGMVGRCSKLAAAPRRASCQKPGNDDTSDSCKPLVESIDLDRRGHRLLLQWTFLQFDDTQKLIAYHWFFAALPNSIPSLLLITIGQTSVCRWGHKVGYKGTGIPDQITDCFLKGLIHQISMTKVPLADLVPNHVLPCHKSSNYDVWSGRRCCCLYTQYDKKKR